MGIWYNARGRRKRPFTLVAYYFILSSWQWPEPYHREQTDESLARTVTAQAVAGVNATRFAASSVFSNHRGAWLALRASVSNNPREMG